MSALRIKIDENLPSALAELLRGAGHDADTVLQEHLQGATDARLAKACQDDRRALITLDSDFADIRTYEPRDYHGIIVLRLGRTDKAHVVEVCRRLLPLLRTEDLAGRLWIVQEHAIRIHE